MTNYELRNCYTAQNLVYVLRDRSEDGNLAKAIRFHVENDDYFGTMATVIDLYLQINNNKDAKGDKLLKRLRRDMMYLQDNYYLKSKEKK
ncbi:hypothetical protein KJ855_03960 [Patescibacteria group bacterium]|nr:hypothetical protein [Patescibacteria group bacterium]